MESQPVEDVVTSALESLVHHFCQPIHETIERETREPPYFDELLGYPPRISSVVQHWMDKILSSSSSAVEHEGNGTNKNDAHRDRMNLVMSLLLGGYVDTVRGRVLDENKGFQHVALLQNFELLCWMIHQRTQQQAPAMSAPSSIAVDTMKVLAQDILSLTKPTPQENRDEEQLEAAENDDDDACNKTDNYARCNIVLPTLLRLLTLCVERTDNSSLGDPTKFGKDETYVSVILALLPFGDSRMDARSILPEQGRPLGILPWNDCGGMHRPLPTTLHLEWIDWTKTALDDSAWNDPVTGIAKRVAHRCCQQLQRRLDPLEETEQELDPLVTVCNHVGWERLAKSIRSHFFGREGASSQASTKNQKERRRVSLQQYPLQFKSTTKPLPAYRRMPSLVHMSLRYIGMLQQPNHQILLDMLPVCYALLDSIDALMIAMGASALIRLLETSSRRTINEDWDGLQEPLWSVLELALKTCREAPAWGLVCRAASTYFRVFRADQQRRQTTVLIQETILARSQQARDDEDAALLGLILGGLLPLLRLQENFEAVDFGRPCLKTLLSLLSLQPAVGYKLQLASLVTLVHFMEAASPILPRHGGKVMCHLLACCGNAARADNDEDDDKTRREVIVVAQHAAVQALLYCGTRAEEVINTILQPQEHPYDDDFGKLCQDIHGDFRQIETD